MAKRKAKGRSLRSFVARAISDFDHRTFGYRGVPHRHSQLAKIVIGAVRRGKARGLR